MVLSVAACGIQPGPLRASDCFGEVPYSFIGWTSPTDVSLQPSDALEADRVFVMITRDEVVLTVTPSAPDGSTQSLVGRGICWTDGSGSISKAAFEPAHMEPNP